MHIDVEETKVEASTQKVFGFLDQVENFEKLMPESIETFEVLDPNTFKFALSGMPTIILTKKEAIPNSTIIYGSASDKLPFTLTADIREITAESSSVQLNFEGQFNAMMAMMIKGPITKFLQTLTENMKVIAQ